MLTIKINTKKYLQYALIFILAVPVAALAHTSVVNIYAWTSYLPNEVIKQFEKENHIRINLDEYDSNETMYAKLKASPNSGYDIIMPSNYFLNRMRLQNMLHKIDKTRLGNFKFLNSRFLNKASDPHNDYSVPYLWGATGITVNGDYIDPKSIQGWNDLWQPRFCGQLLVLDDLREVFSIALLALHYPINDTDPEHIKAAYLKLKALLPNIKIFNSDAIQTIYIDEDAVIGMGWNGDINLAMRENRNLKFIYPKDGFVLWVDSLAIAKNAPHLENAHKFINFILRPDIAAKISMRLGFATANREALKLLSKEMRNNKVIFPDPNTLKHGQMQDNIDEALPLYEKYWEQLKIGG